MHDRTVFQRNGRAISLRRPVLGVRADPLPPVGRDPRTRHPPRTTAVPSSPYTPPSCFHGVSPFALIWVEPGCAPWPGFTAAIRSFPRDRVFIISGRWQIIQLRDRAEKAVRDGGGRTGAAGMARPCRTPNHGRREGSSAYLQSRIPQASPQSTGDFTCPIWVCRLPGANGKGCSSRPETTFQGT